MALEELAKEITSLKRKIELLPPEHTLRRQYETKLAELQTQLEAEARQKEISVLRGEMERLSTELKGEAARLAGYIGMLAAEVRATTTPEEIAALKAMVEEVREWHEGLIMPWKEKITRELATKKLWLDRIARGECELVSHVMGKYADYESYHHLPTCETWVRTIPRPYTGR